MANPTFASCQNAATGQRFEFNDLVWSDPDQCWLPARITRRGLTFLAKDKVAPYVLQAINESPEMFRTA